MNLKFSHFEKTYDDNFESITLFYSSVDDLVRNNLFKSISTSYEESEKSASEKVSEKLYKLNSDNKPVCFFMRDTCTNKTNANCQKNLLEINSNRPLIRTIKNITQLRNVDLSQGHVSPENFQSLLNETSIKFSLDDKRILTYRNIEGYSSKNDHIKLKKNSAYINLYNFKGKIAIENDSIKEASGNLAMTYLKTKYPSSATERDKFNNLIKTYCYPESLHDICSLSNNTCINASIDQSSEDFLEDKFFSLGFERYTHFISKFDIHSALNESIYNFKEDVDLIHESTTEIIKDNESGSELSLD